MTEAELEQARARAARSLGSSDLDALFGQWRAVIGPPADELPALARAALEAIAVLRDPTPEQLQALELAIRLLRPAPLVRDGAVQALRSSGSGFEAWEPFCERIRPHLRAIGRVDLAPTPGRDVRHVGTGFLVSTTRLVTNRHVLDQLSLGTGVLARGQVVVRFGAEHGSADLPQAVVDGVVAVHELLDLAIVAVSEVPAEALPIPVGDGGAVDAGTDVATIGFPLRDARNPEWIEPLFAGRYGVKRASPGEVTGGRTGLLYHDCTTLGGSSGSPVIRLEDATLVGVHADGMFVARNHAVAGEEAMAFLGSAA